MKKKLKHLYYYIIHDRFKIVDYVVTKCCFWLPDKPYTQLRYRLNMGCWPDLKSPQSFNEKLQWLKLFDRKNEYTTMVDKYAVKQYVAEKIGQEYVVPLLGVWDRPEYIDWDLLPDQFVLKTTHGGGNMGVIICHDKASFDKKKAVKTLNSCLRQDLYKLNREWPYKNVKKKIIAEEYITDPCCARGEGINDYKFFCFDGEVKAMFVGSERQTREEPYFDFFDSDYNLLPIRQGHPNSPIPPEKPLHFELMKELAAELSKDHPVIRIDFYETSQKVYFGEMTFYHFGGMVPFHPNDIDYKWGEWVHINNERIDDTI